jgi:prepilin-type processing-associated H-X9-DG protein
MATKPCNDERAQGTIKAGTSTSPYQMRGNLGSIFQAWEITSPRPRFRSSYGFNIYLFNDLFDSSYRYIDTYSIKGSAKVPLLLDSTAPLIPFFEFTKPPQNEQDGSGFIINRHNGYVNGLFLDWSVRKIGLKELWTLKWNKQFDTSNEWTKTGGVQPEDWPEWMRNFKDY